MAGTGAGAGLNAPAAAVVDGRILLVGGIDTSTNIPVASVPVYDIRWKRWSPLPLPPGVCRSC